jgi:hypothetical protein
MPDIDLASAANETVAETSPLRFDVLILPRGWTRRHLVSSSLALVLYGGSFGLTALAVELRHARKPSQNESFLTLVPVPEEARKPLVAPSPKQVPKGPSRAAAAGARSKPAALATKHSAAPPRPFTVPAPRPSAAPPPTIETPAPELKAPVTLSPTMPAAAPVVQQLTRDISPPPPQVPLGDFFREYAKLNAAGRTLLWNMPNPKLSVLDDGRGLWFQFVCRLQRPILFYYRGPGETKTLIWSPATRAFAAGDGQPAGAWPLRILNAWLDPDVKDLAAEAARQFRCNASRVEAVALYTDKDFQVAIGKVAREAELKKVPLLKVSGATLIYSDRPALDLVVVDLRTQQ